MLQLQLALRLDRVAFARLLGVSERAVRNWEKGRVEVVGPARELARALQRWHAQPKSQPVVMALATRSASLGAALDTLFDALTTVEYLKLR